MFDGLLLQADDASDGGSVDNDSDLEVVEAVEVNVVQPEDLGDLLMAVGAPEIEPEGELEAEGVENLQRTIAETVQAIADRARPTRTRNRPDVLTMAAMVYHFEHISKSKKETARHFGLSDTGGAKQVRGYVKKKSALQKQLKELRDARKPLASRKALPGSGRRANHPELERQVVEWRREQIAAGIKVRPGNMWTVVRELKKKMNIKGRLGRNWRELFRKRHNLRIKREKRCVKVTRQVLEERLRQFHTFMQVQQQFQNFTYTGNFDEAPVSFSGDFARSVVVHADDGDEGLINFESSGADDAKRFFTYLPLVVVETHNPDAAVEQPDPICIFKGEGNVYAQEKNLYAPGVQVFFQPSAVVDQHLMVDIYSSWDKFFKKAGDPMRILVGDSCKSHFTAIAKAKVSSRTCFARIGESCTSLTQYLDTDHMHVFKHHYSNIFSTQVEPKLKGRKICARERRILVTRIVAQAHALTLQSTQRKNSAEALQS